jgi:hypothetical protein
LISNEIYTPKCCSIWNSKWDLYPKAAIPKMNIAPVVHRRINGHRRIEYWRNFSPWLFSGGGLCVRDNLSKVHIIFSLRKMYTTKK